MAFDVGSIVGKLELGIEGWKKSIEAVKKDQQSLSGFALRHKDEIEKLGKGMVVAGGAMVATLGALVIKTASYGDKIYDLSQRTGVATEVLSGYKLAADNSGTSIDGVATAFKFLSQRMVDADEGGKESIAMFKSLGVEVTNADGSLRDSNAVMLDVADRFASMEDGAQKTALAVDIFGRSGMELIPFLNLGKQGLKENYENAERFGMVLSKEAAKAADEFNDALGNMKSSLAGAGMAIGTVLMPVVKDLIDRVTAVTAKVRGWAAEHPELTAAVTMLAGGIGALLLTVGPLLIALPSLIKGFGLLKTAMSSSIGVIGGVAAAAGIAYVALNAMIDAKNRATEAAYEASEKERMLGQRLREATDAAGLSRAEFHQLYLKYGESNAALNTAIGQGKEGKVVQEALTEVIKKQAAALKDQKEKFDPVAKLLEELARLQKELKAAIGGTSTEITATAIPAARNLASVYGGIIQKLELLPSALPAPRDLSGVFENLVPIVEDVGDKIVSDFRDATNEMAQAWANMITTIAQGWAAAFVGMFNLMGILIGEATKHNDEYFKKAYSDIDKEYQARKKAIEDEMKAEETALEAEYMKRRQYILENVTDEGERVRQLKELETWKSDELEKIRILGVEKQKKAQKELDDLDKWYADERERIRKDEEKSREDHAESEKKRQDSLWTKVKGVFGKALEDMATAWVTTLVTPILASIIDDLLPNISKIGTSTSDTIKPLGDIFGGFIKSLATAIGTLATALATMITTLATAVGTALVTLATAIASAATILAAAAGPIAIVLGIFLAAYAAFRAIESLFAGGGQQTDVTYWLKFIRESTKETRDWLFINAQDKLNFYVAKFNEWHEIFSDIRARLDNILSIGSGIQDMLGAIADNTARMASYLEGMETAQTGTVTTRETLLHVHAREIVAPEDRLREFLSRLGGSAQPIIIEMSPVRIEKNDYALIRYDARLRRGDIPIPVMAVRG